MAAGYDLLEAWEDATTLEALQQLAIDDIGLPKGHAKVLAKRINGSRSSVPPSSPPKRDNKRKDARKEQRAAPCAQEG